MNNRNYNITKKEDNFWEHSPWFDDFFNFPFFNSQKHFNSIMKTDISEENNSYKLVMEIPGIKKENVKIELNDDMLTVTAITNNNSDTSDDKYIKQERFTGTYTRSFYVGELTEEQITANLADGILTIYVPKDSKKQNNKKIININ